MKMHLESKSWLRGILLVTFTCVFIFILGSQDSSAFVQADLDKLKTTNKCENCDLSGANLSDANLEYANLMCANLNGANLESAHLTHSNMTKAQLINANLDHAYLDSTNLSGANLLQANLADADLSVANLNSANLFAADFSNANLDHAHLERANLAHVNWNHANLESAKLTCATNGRFADQHIIGEHIQYPYLSPFDITPNTVFEISGDENGNGVMPLPGCSGVLLPTEIVPNNRKK
jgi:hypothetical protein